MALAWLELQAAIANRVGEPEDITGATVPVGELDIPYNTQTIIENELFEISNQLLREVPPDTLEAIGSPAINTHTYTTSGATLVAGTVKILSAAIRPQNVGTTYVGTQPMSPAIFVQVQNADPTLISGWSVFNDGFNYIGYDARVVAIVEPVLATWQSDPSPPILPDGYDETRIDWVCKQLQIMNFMPRGGV
jgi:hypothetical protein